MFGMLCNSSLGINTIWFISFSICFLSFTNLPDGGKQLKKHLWCSLFHWLSSWKILVFIQVFFVYQILRIAKIELKVNEWSIRFSYHTLPIMMILKWIVRINCCNQSLTKYFVPIFLNDVYTLHCLSIS